MKKRNTPSCALSQQSVADFRRVRGPYVEYLSKRGLARTTIRNHLRMLSHAIRGLNQRGRSLSALVREDVDSLTRRLWPRYRRSAAPRAALNSWLKYLGCFHASPPPSPAQSWLDSYSGFIEHDRGLSPYTRRGYLRVARSYLAWQFGHGAVCWRRIGPEDIWRYAARLCRGRKPIGARDDLSALRQFLRFAHLRGSCASAITEAVPTIAIFGQQTRARILSEKQRRELLASFNRQTAQGKRDYAMALCMLDLGLRAVEVIRLRLADIDWKRQAVSVPPAKASRGRQLPLPPRVAEGIRLYLPVRPVTNHDRLFVGQTIFIGAPLTPAAVAGAVHRAYCRCGFDHRHGTHRLRHTFATRLYAHGARMKEIADLLGHRRVVTTQRYTQVDQQGLRSVVQQWPA